MGRKAFASASIARPWLAPLTSRINLTAAKTEAGQEPTSVEVTLAEFITYSQHGKHTRLSLKGGGRILDVQETTDHIDRLVRAAASQT